MNGMIPVAVVHVVIEVFVECGGRHLPVRIGDGDDLVLCEFHRSRLMDIDMATGHADHALILVKHRVDGGGVGLGTSRQEENLCIGQAAGFADAVLGPLAELIEAVRRWLGIIVFH